MGGKGGGIELGLGCGKDGIFTCKYYKSNPFDRLKRVGKGSGGKNSHNIQGGANEGYVEPMEGSEN